MCNDTKDTARCSLPESATLLDDIARKEYDTENERAKNLDIKGNMLFVLCTTPLFGILGTTKWRGYYEFLRECNKTIPGFAVRVIDLFLLVLSVVGFVGAFFYAVRVIDLRTYQRIPLDVVAKRILQYSDKSSFSLYVASQYNEAVLSNKAVNDEKAKCFSRAVQLLQVSIVLFLVWSVAHSFS